MQADVKTFLVFGLVFVFIGFRVYRSLRRNIGRQRLLKVPLMVRALMFLAAGGMVVALSAQSNGAALAGVLAGALIGAGIALYALTHTRIERTGEEIFYTGHPYIGLGIIGLFLARLAFNLATVLPKMQEAQAQAHSGAQQAMLSQNAANPLTLGIVALMVGYYFVYSLGLLRMARSEQE